MRGRKEERRDKGRDVRTGDMDKEFKNGEKKAWRDE